MSEERAVKMGFERAGELEQVKLGDCLWDVHAAGMKLLEFTSGRSFEEYSESELLQSVVSTMLKIMADRLEQMRRQFPTEFAKIDDASRRNRGPGAGSSGALARGISDRQPSDILCEEREADAADHHGKSAADRRTVSNTPRSPA
jgi:hypothetical protein